MIYQKTFQSFFDLFAILSKFNAAVSYTTLEYGSLSEIVMACYVCLAAFI
jgi:hypothetical protein